MDQPIEITITTEAFLKFRYFIEECPTEVSGFGRVRVVHNDRGHSWEKDLQDLPESYLQIYDIEILSQQASGAHSTIDEEVLAKFNYEKLSNGESLEDYKVWWHSHADMQAYFSGTDTGTIESSTEFDYLISLVGNKAGDMKARLDFHKPFRMTFDDLTIKVEPPTDERIRKLCKEELSKKVNKRKSFFGMFSREDDEQTPLTEDPDEEVLGEDPLGRAFQQ
jgi:proteasome lid subunit RPN8/RPN11